MLVLYTQKIGEEDEVFSKEDGLWTLPTSSQKLVVSTRKVGEEHEWRWVRKIKSQKIASNVWLLDNLKPWIERIFFFLME